MLLALPLTMLAMPLGSSYLQTMKNQMQDGKTFSSYFLKIDEHFSLNQELATSLTMVAL